MKSKSIDIARPRLDVALMFVCVFAILGGLSIYRSYADAIPVVATKKSTVILKKPLISSQPNTQASARYSISTLPNQKYCFLGTHSGDVSITEEVKSGKQTTRKSQNLSGPSTGPTELICFNSIGSSASVKIQVKGTVSVGSIVAS